MLLWWAELSKPLFCLSADGWDLVPSLLVVWPEVTQHWSIPGSLVGLMVDSGRVHTKEFFPELLLPVSLSLGEPQPPPASAGDPPTPAGRSGSVSCGVTAPSPRVPMHTLPCVCPSRVDTRALLFPQVL